jgi:hypothetical protein
VSAAEIIMFDDYLVVYKCLGDLMFYVTGSLNENELILYSVLQAFYEATSALLRCASNAAGLVAAAAAASNSSRAHSACRLPASCRACRPVCSRVKQRQQRAT